MDIKYDDAIAGEADYTAFQLRRTMDGYEHRINM